MKVFLIHLKMLEWKEWSRKEITLLLKGICLFSIGAFLMWWFGNLAVYFWLNDVSAHQPKEFRGAFLGLFLFFLGGAIDFWAIFILEKIIKKIWIKPRKAIEAVEWQHFKVSQEIEPIKVTNSIPEIVEVLKIPSKPQMLTRANKDIIKTTQPNAVLNEEDVEKIKISLNFTNTKSKL